MSIDDQIKPGVSPGVNALAHAKALRSEGKHDEADAVLEAHEAELAAKEQTLAAKEHKAKRKANLELAAHVDPEADNEIAEALDRVKARMLPNGVFIAGQIDPAPYAKACVNRWAHLDSGPAPKGQPAPAFLLFERFIKDAEDPTIAAKACEAKFDARMNAIHHYNARVWMRTTFAKVAPLLTKYSKWSSK